MDIENIEIFFSKYGISLNSIGVNEYAFTYENSLLVINEIEKLKIPILGGDVLIMLHNKPKYTGDSWACDRGENEPINEYIQRSIERARNYIREYHKKNKVVSFFSIIIDVEKVPLVCFRKLLFIAESGRQSAKRYSKRFGVQLQCIKFVEAIIQTIARR